MQVRVIAIIPARGGSKGIPRKNLQDIAGDPLVGRKINQAKSSSCTEVWVSTDDAEIAQMSISYGAKIIHRPDFLASDESSTDDMLMHAIDELECNDLDVLVLLQPTSPLLELSTINDCIQHLLDHTEFNSVITIKEGHPFMWESQDGVLWNPDGHTRVHRPRRQELGIGGWETGGCYAIRASSLRQQAVRYPAPTSMVNVTYLEALDIDTYDDLEVVRQLLRENLDNNLKGDTHE